MIDSIKKCLIIIFFICFSCGTIHNAPEIQPLFEILTQKDYGGASFRFFEILSEPKEIQMLLNDNELKKKFSPLDIQNSNFIILNLGEKPSSGYSIEIEDVVETDKNIMITVKEVAPKSDDNVLQAIANPFLILKINSKKEIIFK